MKRKVPETQRGILTRKVAFLLQGYRIYYMDLRAPLNDVFYRAITGTYQLPQNPVFYLPHLKTFVSVAPPDSKVDEVISKDISGLERARNGMEKLINEPSKNFWIPKITDQIREEEYNGVVFSKGESFFLDGKVKNCETAKWMGNLLLMKCESCGQYFFLGRNSRKICRYYGKKRHKNGRGHVKAIEIFYDITESKINKLIWRRNSTGELEAHLPNSTVRKIRNDVLEWKKWKEEEKMEQEKDAEIEIEIKDYL